MRIDRESDFSAERRFQLSDDQGRSFRSRGQFSFRLITTTTVYKFAKFSLTAEWSGERGGWNEGRVAEGKQRRDPFDRLDEAFFPFVLPSLPPLLVSLFPPLCPFLRTSFLRPSRICLLSLARFFVPFSRRSVWSEVISSGRNQSGRPYFRLIPLLNISLFRGGLDRTYKLDIEFLFVLESQFVPMHTELDCSFRRTLGARWFRVNWCSIFSYLIQLRFLLF